MQDHDLEYCTFDELSAQVVTWNAGAATPSHLRCEDRESRFLRDTIHIKEAPDLIVFAFQELVDLEDKKMTASTCPLWTLTCAELIFYRGSIQR